VSEPPPTEPYLPRPAVPAQPGTVGDCRLVREIGRGGMGVVYEAVQEPLGRRVAVKLLPAIGTAARERFQREAQAAARLHHTNIVPVFAHGEQAGQSYYVRQLIPGVGVDRVLAARAAGLTPGPAPLAGLPPAAYYRAVARIGLQAADALAYAHAEGVLHRDIKPANLLLDDRGTVWVTDFGVAKMADDPHHTRPGELVGTLYYLPPERLNGQSDARGDVYSLGVTLYELLTAKSAFPDTTPEQLLKQIPVGLPTRPREAKPDIPADLETIVLKATASAPGGRYQSAGELADDLRRFLDDRPILARRARLAERAVQWARREPRLAAAAAAIGLLLAAVAGTAALAYRTKQEELRNEKEYHQRDMENADRGWKQDAHLAGLALDGLNRTYSRLAPTRLVAVAPDESADSLRELLKTYQAIVEAADPHTALAARVGEATRRIGDIHQRLGQFAEAETAYTDAIERLKADPGDDARLQRAQALNERGRVRRRLQMFDQARADHRAALAELDGGGDGFVARPEVIYERVYTLWAEFDRDLLYHLPDEESAQLRRKAVGLIQPLATGQKHTPECVHLYGMCLASVEGDRASLILRSLALEHPTVPDYEMSLCDVLGMLRPRVAESPAARVRRIEEAAKRADDLARRYPAVTRYTAARARYWDFLGIALFEQVGTPDAVARAENCHRAAIDIQHALIKQFPKVAEYDGRLGMMERALGRAVGRRDRAEGRKLYESGIRRVEQNYATNRDALTGYRPFLQMAYTEYAELLAADGETAGAKQYKQKADAVTPSPR
jgi:eukaryotic-like serine/threonine-protein kinase